MKKAFRLFAMFLALMTLLSGILLTAAAAGVEQNTTCRLRVKLKTADEAPRPDASISAYLVATPDETAPLFYSLAPEFADSGFSITPTIPDEAAALLDDFTTEKGLSGKTENTDQNGVATFTDLAEGIYLIKETGKVDVYTRMLPFLVVLPAVDGDSMDYDVEASPKPVSELPPASFLLTAKKQISIGKGTIPERPLFSFILTPEEITNPMPKNEDGSYNPETGALTVSRIGEGDVYFGEIPFRNEDAGKTFVYTVRELKGTEQYFTYDTTLYTVSIRIVREDDGTLSVIPTYTVGDTEADLLLFTNKYDKPDGPPDIPKTGQLWWPVGVLTGAGILLLLGGFLLHRREEETA